MNRLNATFLHFFNKNPNTFADGNNNINSGCKLNIILL